MHKYIISIILLLAIPLYTYSQADTSVDVLSAKAEITGTVSSRYYSRNKKEEFVYFTRIEITNQTDSVLTLYSPKCYWGKSWVLDSKEFTFNDWGCDHNSFQDIELKPQKSTIFYAAIHSPIHPDQSKTFKIGYIMLNREEWYTLLNGGMKAKEKKEFFEGKKVYWSNPVGTNFNIHTFKIDN